MTSSTRSPEKPGRDPGDIWERLRVAQSLAGLQATMNSVLQTSRWVERDTAAQLRVLYGPDDEGDVMSDSPGVPSINLGDTSYSQPPVIVPPGGGGVVPVVAAAIRGGGIPAAGLAGYALSEMASRDAPVELSEPDSRQDVDTDTRLEIRLGRDSD